jgi:glycosyltransferase involved in cell wall biosynthesis
MSVPSVTVVISTYERPKALNLVLDGLARQRITPVQILIADDGSGPKTLEVIEKWRRQDLPIEHCWQEDKGFRKTTILNQAIAKTKAPYLIFLDGDCVPLARFVEDHLSFAQVGCILAGSRVLAFESYTLALEAEREHLHSKSAFYWFKQKLIGNTNRWCPQLRLPDGAWRTFRPRNWRLVRGCNFSIFTEDLLRVGGYDESFVGWGREDSELAVRLINAGLQVKSMAYAANVVHLWHREERRNSLAENDFLLQKSIIDRRITARVGLRSTASTES